MDNKINPECNECRGSGTVSLTPGSIIALAPCSSCISWSEQNFCELCGEEFHGKSFPLSPTSSYRVCLLCIDHAIHNCEDAIASAIEQERNARQVLEELTQAKENAMKPLPISPFAKYYVCPPYINQTPKESDGNG